MRIRIFRVETGLAEAKRKDLVIEKVRILQIVKIGPSYAFGAR